MRVPPVRPHMGNRRAVAALAGLLCVLGILGVLHPIDPAGAAPRQDGSPADDSRDTAERVLVLSLPGLRWTDVEEHDLPAITAFLEDAALADHAPRAVARAATPGAAYLTISAGARTTSHALIDGQQLALDDRSAGSAAAEIFERRTGTSAEGDYVSLAWPSLLRRNAAQPYDAELGLLADTLSDAGLYAGVVGNADGTDTVADSNERQVGLAITSSDGVIRAGDLDTDLLVTDPARPFGLRMDVDLAVERFREHWRAAAPGHGANGGTVVVEASDLARTMRYRDSVDSSRYDELWADALADADELAGRLLEEVDPARDAVLLLAPYNLPGDRDLTAAALQTPDSAPGYLRSASTQRTGFVTLVDVSPTLLELLGVERPITMEGRPFEVAASSDSLPDRVERLIAANDASRFREHLLVPTTLVAVVILGLACAAAIAVVARRGTPQARHGVTFLALFAMAILPMSYLARAFPLERLGLSFYWLFVTLGALLTAGTALLLARNRQRVILGLVAVLALVLAVPAIDAMTGSNLSLSAAFGYSPTGNSRLYGVSNYALGQIVAAGCLLAGLLASVRSARWARAAAVGLLVVVLAVIGVPMWGANVGGTLSFAPVVALFAALVLRDRINLRNLIIGFVTATAAAISAFALLDLARPPAQRAHLGRLVERLGDEGMGPLMAFMERKGEAAINASLSTFWLAAIPVAIAFMLFMIRYPDRPWGAVRTRIPTLQAGLIAAITAAVLGSIANDSGAVVGGVALLVVTAALIYLVLELAPLHAQPPPDEASPPVPERASVPNVAGESTPDPAGHRATTPATGSADPSDPSGDGSIENPVDLPSR
jgi:hypothetical protein